MPGCPIKVTGTWWAQTACRAQQSLIAAVSISEVDESKPPNMAFLSKYDACKKHILLDDESRTDFFFTRARNNNLPPAFFFLLDVATHFRLCLLMRDPELSSLLPWGCWALSEGGDKFMHTSLFPCLIFCQTVLQMHFIMLPLCIEERHPLPL